MIDRSATVNNFTGIFATGEAVVRIGDSTVTGNGTGLATARTVADHFLLDQQSERQRHRRHADQHDPDEID